MTRRLERIPRPTPAQADGEDGFMLIAVIIMVFLVLLVLSIAAPRVATQLKRERELETKHRGEQYVVAIRKFYGAFGRYPGSMKELENTNNQRFLRQDYVDPLTGKSDWRLIHLGENKTNVKGLFGQELPGLSGGLGAAAGMQSGPNGVPGLNGSGSPTGFGTSGQGAAGSPGGAGPGGGSAFQNNLGSGSGPGTSPGSGLGTGAATGAPGTSTASGAGGAFGGPSDSGLGGLNATGGIIMGIGTPQKGDSIASVNGESTYQKWEFLYDPRIEQLRAGWSVFGGGGGGSVPAGSLGTGGLGTGTGGVPGSSPGTGFGSGQGSGFGSGIGNGQPGLTAPGSTTPGATLPGATTPPAQNPQNPQNPQDPNQPGSSSPPVPPTSPQ